jgi:hypothetical protein
MLVDYDCFLSTQTWPPLEPTPIYSDPFMLSLESFETRSRANIPTAPYLSPTDYPVLSPTISVDAFTTHNSGGAAAAQTPQRRRDTMLMPGQCKKEGEHGVKVMYLNSRYTLDPRNFCGRLGNTSCEQQCHQIHAWCARYDGIFCQTCWGRSGSGHFLLAGRPKTGSVRLGVEGVKESITGLGKEC